MTRSRTLILRTNHDWNYNEQETVPLLREHRKIMGLIEEAEEGQISHKNHEVQQEFKAKKFPQFAASFIAGMCLFSAGGTMVWTSPALPDLEDSGKFENLTTTDTSWIASVVTLGSVICGPPVGYLVDRVGRKTTMLILSVPFFLGWIIIAFAPAVIYMIIGRFILGFCVGGFIMVTILYMTEISEPKIRGMVMSLTSLTMGGGMLTVYIVGAYASWFTLTLVLAGVSFVFIFLVLLIPESPVYLVSKGKLELSEKSLMRLRGARELSQVEEELNSLIAHSKEMEEIQKRVQGTLWTNMRRPGTMKAFGISLVLAALQQLEGINAVNFYTLKIFEASNTNIDANLSSIIIGLDICITGVIVSQVIDRLGRRKLLIFSQIGLIVCLTALGAFFYTYRDEDDKPPASVSWVPIASLVMFQFFFMIGVGPLAWGIMGEILPYDVKGPASAIVTSFNWLLAFAVTKTFEDIANSIGIYSCFWIFAGVSLFGLVFSILVIPETGKKSLEEIQRLYFS